MIASCLFADPLFTLLIALAIAAGLVALAAAGSQRLEKEWLDAAEHGTTVARNGRTYRVIHVLDDETIHLIDPDTFEMRPTKIQTC